MKKKVDKMFHMELAEGGAGDYHTLRSLFQFLYDGCIDDQAALLSTHYGLPRLMAAAAYLQAEHVIDACKIMLDERLARQDVSY